jgi:hypothetical protein
MWMRILLFYDAACISKPLVIYRLHERMTSASRSDQNGLNLSGLKEHYLASNIVIEQYKERIPQWKNLKKQVNAGFSMKAFRRGVLCLKSGKLSESLSSLTTALKFYPPVFAKKVFWTFIWSLIRKQFQKISTGVPV